MRTFLLSRLTLSLLTVLLFVSTIDGLPSLATLNTSAKSHPSSASWSQYVTEYDLPKNSSNAVPGPITVAPNGSVWFVETNSGKLGEFMPLSRNFAEFPIRNSSTYRLPRSATFSVSSISTDPKGNVWFSLSYANAIGYLNVTDLSFEYYNLTQLTQRSANSFPLGLTVDSSGIVWIAENTASRIGRLDPANASYQEYKLSQPNALPSEVFVDGSHIVWATSIWYNNTGRNPTSGSTLTRLDPTTGSLISYELSSVGILAPVGVAVDKTGSAWIGDHGGSWIGEVNTALGEVKIHRTSLPPLVPNPHNLTDRVYGGAPFSLVNDVVLGNDGTPWFIEHLGGRVGHYLSSTETLVEYNIPTLTPGTLWLAADLQGRIWFTEAFGNKIGYLNTQNAAPPFRVNTQLLTAQLIKGATVSFTITVTDNSTNPISIEAGVENTFDFTGPITNITMQPGESRSISVEVDSTSNTLIGNYSTASLASLTPVIKITDGSVNYPITVLLYVSDSSILNQPIWVYGTILTLAVAATITGTMILSARRKVSPSRNSE